MLFIFDFSYIDIYIIIIFMCKLLEKPIVIIDFIILHYYNIITLNYTRRSL